MGARLALVLYYFGSFREDECGQVWRGGREKVYLEVSTDNEEFDAIVPAVYCAGFGDRGVD